VNAVCIATTEHLPALNQLASEQTESTVEFLVVEDCATWSTEHGIAVHSNPNAMALRRHRDGAFIIVLREAYDAQHIQNTSQALLFAGWVREAEEVREPSAFLRFLVLHELAHLLNQWGQEREQECNEWAFHRLGWAAA